jgi:hypothetical protein
MTSLTNTGPGVYNGTAAVNMVGSYPNPNPKTRGRASADTIPDADAMATPYTVHVAIRLTVAGPVVPNGGDDDPTRGTRLHWLNSRAGSGDDGTLPAPFTPLEVVRCAFFDRIFLSRMLLDPTHDHFLKRAHVSPSLKAHASRESTFLPVDTVIPSKH